MTDTTEEAEKRAAGPKTAKGVSIGDKFMSHGKHPRECTVADIYTTTNSAGDVVKIEFKAVHQFMGQEVSQLVPATTVQLRRVSPRADTAALAKSTGGEGNAE